MKTWGPGNRGEPTQEGGERTSQDDSENKPQDNSNYPLLEQKYKEKMKLINHLMFMKILVGGFILPMESLGMN